MKDTIKLAIETLKEYKEKTLESISLQTDLWEGKVPSKRPLLLTCKLTEEQEERFPQFNLKEIHYDSEKMFLNELRGTLQVINADREAVPSVRANMGCGIFPTLFGVEQKLFEDKMPWVTEHMTKEELSKMGPEDLKIGKEFKAGLEHMAYMTDMLEGTGCGVYPMDLQGPFDTAHIVYGDAIFYDIYDDPQFLHHLLQLSCHAIIMGMEECFKIIKDSDKRIHHYNSLVMPKSKGGIKISEDTSTLLSKEQIEEFVTPYTKKVLSHFNGGYIHYCGQNPHLFEAVMEEPLALGLNFGNPEMHDMEYVLKRCQDKNKIYYGFIPKKESETHFEFFNKYLKASLGLYLPQYVSSNEERDQVSDAWDKSCTSSL